MKFIIFFLVFFSLPHAAWIPNKLHKLPEEIPLGMTNLILVVSALLFFFGISAGKLRKNHFKPYTYFLIVVVLGTLVGIITDFEGSHMETLRLAKREISLLLMYFLPLAFIKNQRDFKIVCMICLFIHAVIGLEVMSSGVLGGSNFGDHKRGSGPFGATGGVVGSDVAGSYLAQFIMFFVAILMTRGMAFWLKCASAFSVLIIVQGIFATYGRGAILGCGLGVLFLPIIKGLNVKTIVLAIIILCVAVIFCQKASKHALQRQRLKKVRLTLQTRDDSILPCCI